MVRPKAAQRSSEWGRFDVRLNYRGSIIPRSIRPREATMHLPRPGGVAFGGGVAGDASRCPTTGLDGVDVVVSVGVGGGEGDYATVWRPGGVCGVGRPGFDFAKLCGVGVDEVDAVAAVKRDLVAQRRPAWRVAGGEPVKMRAIAVDQINAAT